MLLWRELEGMQAKTPLWLASTRAISSELTVVSSAASVGSSAAAARENTMRTLGDAAAGANEGVSTGDDEGVTSTS